MRMLFEHPKNKQKKIESVAQPILHVPFGVTRTYSATTVIGLMSTPLTLLLEGTEKTKWPDGAHVEFSLSSVIGGLW